VILGAAVGADPGNSITQIRENSGLVSGPRRVKIGMLL
jgi:hypothetical protein